MNNSPAASAAGLPAIGAARRPRLYLSTVGDDFDPATDIAAGPWCFIDAEDRCPTWEGLTFPDPFPEADDIITADAKTRRLANRLAGEWADRLNRRHGRAYSRGYWRTLVIMWMATAVPALWARYRRIEEIVAAHGHRELDVIVADDAAGWPIPDLHRFNIFLTFDAGFDLWMSSLILRTMVPARWRLQPVTVNPDPELLRTASLGPPRSKPLVRAFKKTVPRFSFESVYGVRWWKLFFSLYLNLLPKRRDGKVYFSFDDESIIGEFPQAFLDVLDRFLDATMPETYGGGYPDLERKGLAIKYVPGRIYVDSLGAQMDDRRIVLAHAFESGEKLVCNQHGAGYGTSATMPRASETDYKYHAMLTWGWDAQEDMAGNFVPLPSPLLSRYKDRHRFRKDALILVGMPIDVRGHRFLTETKPERRAEYRRMKARFIDALDARCRDRLIYRPYVRTVTRLRDKEYIRDRYPDLPILEGELHPEMLSCRLLVLDSPGTTMNLSMAANVPTVCFWDEFTARYARQAKPYFEALAACGIVHDSPESAARHIMAHWDDVPGWWSSATVQSARRAWCDRFARSSRLWWLDWMRALAAL